METHSQQETGVPGYVGTKQRYLINVTANPPPATTFFIGTYYVVRAGMASNSFLTARLS